MKKTLAALAVVGVFALSGCSRMEGQFTEKIKTFEDDHGRACTLVKYGDAASVDCDFKP